MRANIPKSIREEDKRNLEKLLDDLDMPFLDVSVPADDNISGYKSIRVYVKPKAIEGRVNIMKTISYVFQVLQQIAEPNSYSPNVSRQKPFYYAIGDISLKIGATSFNLHYSDDTEGHTYKNITKIGKSTFIVTEPDGL